MMTPAPSPWTHAADVSVTWDDVKLGNGAVIGDGDEVVFHYGRADTPDALDAGQFTESSYEDHTTAVRVVIGSGDLTPGLGDAVIGARGGGTRRVCVRSVDTGEVLAWIDLFVVDVNSDNAATRAWIAFQEMPMADE